MVPRGTIRPLRTRRHCNAPVIVGNTSSTQRTKALLKYTGTQTQAGTARHWGPGEMAANSGGGGKGRSGGTWTQGSRVLAKSSSSRLAYCERLRTQSSSCTKSATVTPVLLVSQPWRGLRPRDE